MENSRTIPKEENEPEEDQSIVWLLKGFIFPCWSRKYYKRATQKRVFIAVIFLLIFAFVQSSITTIQVAFAMKNVRNEISGAYEREELPTIWIEDGIARTDSQDQFFFSDKRTVVEIDLTGYAQGIDTSKYEGWGLFFLIPLISFQLHAKARRSKKKGGIDFTRINKILLSKELLFGEHLIVKAVKA